MAAVYPFVVDLVTRRAGESSGLLEVGCGAMQYADHVPGRYQGLDLPGSRYVRGQPHLVGSVEEIPAPDAMFDVVFGVAAFYYVDDVVGAFRECHRVLRPGGSLLVFDYNRETIEQLIAEGDREAMHAWDAQELRARIRAGGFRGGRIRDRSHWARGSGSQAPLRRAARKVAAAVRPAASQWLILEARR